MKFLNGCYVKRPMRQEFHKGDSVEVFAESFKCWIPGVVVMVWKGVMISDGERFVDYDVVVPEFRGSPWQGRVTQDHVRQPGRSKHSTRVLRAKKVKGSHGSTAIPPFQGSVKPENQVGEFGETIDQRADGRHDEKKL